MPKPVRICAVYDEISGWPAKRILVVSDRESEHFLARERRAFEKVGMTMIDRGPGAKRIPPHGPLVAKGIGNGKEVFDPHEIEKLRFMWVMNTRGALQFCWYKQVVRIIDVR